MSLSASTGQLRDLIVLKHCTSDNLLAFGYGDKCETLRVKFKNGAVYDYFNVPPEVWSEFRGADSYGSTLHTQIKPYYQCRRVDFEPGQWDGEERRLFVRPLRVVEDGNKTNLEDAGGDQIFIEARDLPLADERQLMHYLAACVNACRGVPADSMAEVVKAGMKALGMADRRGLPPPSAQPLSADEINLAAQYAPINSKTTEGQ